MDATKEDEGRAGALVTALGPAFPSVAGTSALPAPAEVSEGAQAGEAATCG